MDASGWLVAAVLAPFARVLIYSPILWLVRRFKPSWEKTLFGKWR